MIRKILIISLLMLVCFSSFQSGIASIDGNEFIKESYDLYKVSGWASRTYFLEKFARMIKDFSDDFPRFFRLFFSLLWKEIFLYREPRIQRDSWITFGESVRDWEGHNYDWFPAEGYIDIITPEGDKITYNGTFYGGIKYITPVSPWPDRQVDYYVGVKGFNGTIDGRSFSGTAEHVDIVDNWI